MLEGHQVKVNLNFKYLSAVEKVQIIVERKLTIKQIFKL